MILKQDDVKKKLISIEEQLRTSGIDCVELFFGSQCKNVDPFEITERLKGDFDHNIVLGCGSNDYQALIGIGLSKSDTNAMGELEKDDDILDAFGEFENNYAGMLMDNEAFTGAFGILTQSIAQYSAQNVFYPKAWSCSGYLSLEENCKIYLGFAIRKLIVF
ncbi:hypothetical protein QA601_08290 [Chitinispirillales bacterium ANBcel5]|uniref:hypothetical protein n=1 Tax=Cellulosispirillum alkaliphilum TaxID=3039283 RepID=UPI002A58089B|nr:hypothetical protein [Chitinispirillales bacterium ANBcel5]